MKYKVLLAEKVADEGIDYLEKKGYEVKIGRGIDKKTLIEDLQGCDAVVMELAPIDEEVFKECPKLKVVAKLGVGLNSIDLDAARKYNSRVVFAPSANTVSVAEHTMTLILACAKRINVMRDEYRINNDYAIKEKITLTEVKGKTLGIIGMGKIGEEVVKRAKGFDMDLKYHNRNRKLDIEESMGVEYLGMEDLLKTCDFVVTITPLTEETYHLIGEREFSLMKKNSVFINVARGSVVDEKALIKALQNEEIAGAGLDVTEQEPASVDNPLFKMDNVILTPHCAGSTKDGMRNMAMDATRGIHEILSGKEPTYPVV